MRDNFGRQHDYLRISLTEKCNLRCTYCMPENGVPLTPKEALMTESEIFQIARIFTRLGVDKIRLTGGEPLVRKDAAEIMLGLSVLPVKLSITTNGILIDRFLDTFKKAGINSLNLSLDTLNKERFLQITKRDEFDTVLNNIDLLLRGGFHVKINVVVQKGVNEGEIFDFIEWTKKEDVHVRFIEFMPFDGNSWSKNYVFSYRDILEKVKAVHSVEKLNDKPHATSKAFRVKGYKGTFAVISSMTENFCASCNRLRLTANGKMKNCLFSKGEADLLTPHRNGVNIEPIIRQCILKKKAVHGGIVNIQHLSDADKEIKNRSMILIGG
ncbi:MAG: GTP 3',8-cyclase MoaA [Bacteroidetes bacterium]|nr:MAG: GTP 3',8-cyclase MoaA [Bacteroidota bacterium]